MAKSIPGREHPIAAAVVLLAVAALALLVRWAIGQGDVPWKYLPGTPCRYVGCDVDYDPKRLARCVLKAASLVNRHAGSPSDVLKALAGWYIVVHHGETWTDESGRDVSGHTDRGTSTVCESLETVCHEFGHQWQWRCKGIVDAAHVEWESSGLAEADRQYRAWLASLKM